MKIFIYGLCNICHKKIWRFSGSFMMSVNYGLVHKHCFVDLKFEQDKRIFEFVRTADASHLTEDDLGFVNDVLLKSGITGIEGFAGKRGWQGKGITVEADGDIIVGKVDEDET